MQNQTTNKALNSPSMEQSEIHFIQLLEIFITIMCKHNLSLCFTGKNNHRMNSTNAIANDVCSRINGTRQTSMRIEGLLNYYVALPYEVIRWHDIGRFPEVGNAMNEILSKNMHEAISAANSGLISSDHAIGIVNGITSVLCQTGAISLELSQSANEKVKQALKKKRFFI